MKEASTTTRSASPPRPQSELGVRGIPCAFEAKDARIDAQLVRELAVADAVDGGHEDGATLPSRHR